MARNNRPAAAPTAARGRGRGRGRPRAFGVAGWGGAGPGSSSGAHFHVPGHEIGHSDEVSGGGRPDAALPRTGYGRGGGLGVREGTAKGPGGRMVALGRVLGRATVGSGSGQGFGWTTTNGTAPVVVGGATTRATYASGWMGDGEGDGATIGRRMLGLVGVARLAHRRRSFCACFGTLPAGGGNAQRASRGGNYGRG